MAITNRLSDRYDGLSFKSEGELRRTRALQRFAGSMIDESAAGLTFTIGLSNTGATKNICLFRGDVPATVEAIKDVTGVGVDGVLSTDKDKAIADVTFTCNTNIDYLQAFLNNNPTRIPEIQVSVADEKQLARKIEITQSSPFRKLSSQVIIPKNTQRPSDANSKLVNIPLKNLQLDDQTQMLIEIGEGQSIEITYFVGASRNDAYMLSEAAASSTAVNS